MEARLNRRVGGVTLVVLALAIGFFVFVYGRIDWGSHVRVRVYFHQTGGLREGAGFVVAGRAIGRVETIAPVPRGAPGPLGGDEGVVATVAIDTDDAARLERGGDVFVASRGALSEKYLELGPAPAPGPPLREGDQLLGRDPPSLDRVLQRTWDNLTTVGKFAAELRPELDALRGALDQARVDFGEVPSSDRLGPLIDDASEIVSQIRQLRDGGLGGDAGLARVAEVLDRAHATVASTRAMLARLRGNADALGTSVDALRGRLGTKGDRLVTTVELAVDRVRAAIDKVDPLLAEVQALNERIARGDGSLMKLMHDPEFPEDAKELGKILKRQPWKVIGRPPQ